MNGLEPCSIRWGASPFAPPTLLDFRAAAERIRGVAARTPLVKLHSFNGDNGVYLKPENLQPVNSFKVRGVLNWARTLSPERRVEGLYTISSGNTAQALGYVANLYGVKARSYLSERTPRGKVEAIRGYGVEIEFLSEAEYFGFEPDLGGPGCYFHPFAEPLMVAGNGTIGLEIFEDLPQVETVFCPVGGGGLINGGGRALKALKPGVRVVGVQPENFPAVETCRRLGRPVRVEMKPTLGDGVAAPVTDVMLPLLMEVMDGMVLVSEDEIRAAVRRLALHNKLVVEGAGALSLAAALKTPPSERGATVCVLSGGSIDADKLADIIMGP